MKKLFFILSLLFFGTHFLHASEQKTQPPHPSGLTATRIPPLFWRESDPENQRSFTMALLLYWNARDRNESFKLFAPFYYNSTTAEEKIRIFLPIHFRYDSKDLKMKLWGNYFTKKSLQAETKFLFPFYFRNKTSDTELTYLALFLSQTNPKYHSDIFFPLFWSYRSHEKDGKRYQLLLPLYLKLQSEKERSFFSPFFWAYKDESLSQGLALSYYWRHSADSKVQVGFPLYWRFLKRTDETHFKDIQVGVPWFRYTNEKSSLRTFFPLYWGRDKKIEEDSNRIRINASSVSKQIRWNLFLPIFYHISKPDGSRKIITPAFSRFRDEDGRTYGHNGLNFFVYDIWGGKTEGFFPIFYHRQELDFFKFRYLLYYLEHHQDSEKFETSFFPVFRYRRDSDRRQFLTPLFYIDKDPESRRGFFLNFFWRTEFESEKEKEVILRKKFFIPLLWYYRNPSQKTIIFLPLAAFHKKDQTQFNIIVPLYFQRKKENDTLTFTPFFIKRKSSQKDWLGLFFLFWQNRKENRSSVTLLPLYRRSNFPNGRSVFTPLFYHLKEGEETQGLVGPYFWDYRGQTQYNIFPPIYLNFKRPTWKIKSILPFYLFRSQNLEEKGFFPLWAVSKSVEKTTASFTALSPEELNQETVNLSSSAQTPASLEGIKITTSAPKHFLADSHRFLPFYFYRKLDRGGYDLWLPTILGRIEKEFDAQNEKTIRGRLFLLSYWEISQNYFVNRLDPLFNYYRDKDRKGFMAPTAPFPLWRYEVEGLKSEKEKKVKGAMFPYYWKSDFTSRRDFVFPLFYGRKEWDAENRNEISHVTWLLAYFSSFNRTESKEKKILFPLYWRFVNKHEIMTIVPPVWSERGDNYGREIVFPLWWNFRRDKEKFSLFFPLFMKNSDETTKRSMILMPGFWYSKNPENRSLIAGLYYSSETFEKKEKTKVAFPLYWSVSSPGKETSTVFPLYWKLKTGSRSISYFFPFHFRHKTENFSWNITFPVYWKFETPSTKISVIPPYFSIDSPAEQTRTTGFAPLWVYSRDLRREWKNFQIFGGLFGFEKTGNKKKITIFYLLKI